VTTRPLIEGVLAFGWVHVAATDGAAALARLGTKVIPIIAISVMTSFFMITTSCLYFHDKPEFYLRQMNKVARSRRQRAYAEKLPITGSAWSTLPRAANS
jgi:transglutaminase-like putative cysteine protease